MAFLQVEAVSKQEGQDFSLKEISFHQERFQRLAIAGETGSGKSTLLKIIAGNTSADTGQVIFEGERIKKIPDEKLIPGHPGIAYLSQHFELRNHYRMEELLSYANVLDDAAAAKIYGICKVDHLLKRKATELSGGEKQRMALARLLVSAPRLLILDEPFSNLDMIHKDMLKGVIADIGRQLEISCIMVSHDPLDTLAWADEILVMKDGGIVQRDTPQNIYHRPVNPYVAGLFGYFASIGSDEARMLGFKPKNKPVFLRPEYVQLTDAADGHLKGVVQSSRFYGSFYEVDVLVKNVSLRIKTLARSLEVGKEVFLKVTQPELWSM